VGMRLGGLSSLGIMVGKGIGSGVATLSHGSAAGMGTESGGAEMHPSKPKGMVLIPSPFVGSFV
jgi:hypothetical protein